MKQGTIDFEGSARAAAEASRDARRSLRDADLARLERQVLDAIRSAGILGRTCDEVEVATGLSHQTASARVNRLMTIGAIVEIGKRATRSGRKAVVWADRAFAP